MSTSNVIHISKSDLYEILWVLENRQHLAFEEHELDPYATYGEISDYLVEKIRKYEPKGWTYEQALQKTLHAIQRVKGMNTETLDPNTKLADLFTRDQRKDDMKRIADELKMELKILDSKRPPVLIFSFLLIGSIVWLFVDWRYGLAGILLFYFLLTQLIKHGNEFRRVDTVAKLAYRVMQRKDTVLNLAYGMVLGKEGHAQQVQDLFIKQLGLTTRTIDRDTRIIVD